MASLINGLVVKIAQRCNLNCNYCYMYNHEDQSYLTRPPVMAPAIFDAMLDRINLYCAVHPGHKMSITFHGGEPTLVGKKNFEKLIVSAKQKLGQNLRSISLQTNATLLDAEWVDLFKKHEVHAGVSLDGPPEINDAVRVDHFGKGSHANVVRGLELLQNGDMSPGILCVVNPGLDGLETYRHFRSLGVQRISFLLPDVSHDNKNRFYGNLGPTPVADFLLPIFDEWFAEDDDFVTLQPFWSLMKSLIGGYGKTDDFGSPLMDYLVIDTDGSIALLDALKVCGEGVTDLGLNVVSDDFHALKDAGAFAQELFFDGIDLPDACQSCENRKVCGGGYLPHRYSRANGFNNPSVWCEDIKKIIAHVKLRAGLDENFAAALKSYSQKRQHETQTTAV